MPMHKWFATSATWQANMTPKQRSIWFTRVLFIGSGFMVKFNPQFTKLNKTIYSKNNNKENLEDEINIARYIYMYSRLKHGSKFVSPQKRIKVQCM